LSQGRALRQTARVSEAQGEPKAQEPAQAVEPASRPAALEAAERAFERGDFVQLSQQLQSLEPGSPSGHDHERRAQLERAVEVDPVHIAVLGLCLLGLLAVVMSYL